MATKMVLTREKPKHSEPKEYVFEREYKKEARKIAALEKELKAHEKCLWIALIRREAHKKTPRCRICVNTDPLTESPRAINPQLPNSGEFSGGPVSTCFFVPLGINLFLDLSGNGKSGKAPLFRCRWP